MLLRVLADKKTLIVHKIQPSFILVSKFKSVHCFSFLSNYFRTFLSTSLQATG